jgi:MoaA/NifB/PqqE/SkfB family radical SAM enzyme
VRRAAGTLQREEKICDTIRPFRAPRHIEAYFRRSAMNLHIPDVRILEVHPAPRSTLRSTCRPSSILQEWKDLGLPLLLHAVRDAADLGYNFLNVSAEEPLRYPGLPALCREAHRHGMLTSMIARSTALTARQLEWLRFSIDLLGVEIEGKAASRHRRTRSPRARQSAEQRLAVVRDAGIPFAIVFSLTAASLAELEWAAEFAAAQGASMLHVRPSLELTAEEMATAWTMVECLRDPQRGNLAIQLDAVTANSLPAEPGDLASWKRDLGREARYLGEIVSPLVIEDDGTVTPLRYGFACRFAFGNLHQERLASMTARWIASQAGAFCQVYGTVLHKARTDGRMFGDLCQMLAVEA